MEVGTIVTIVFLVLFFTFLFVISILLEVFGKDKSKKTSSVIEAADGQKPNTKNRGQ